MNQFNKETIIKAFRENLPFGVHTISTAGNIKKALGGISQKEFNQIKKLGLIKTLPDKEYTLPDEWVEEVEEEIKKIRRFK